MNKQAENQHTADGQNTARGRLTSVACTYFVGADGGGTGTRVVLADAAGQELGRGSAGPSGLALGRDKAWQSILQATQQAFAVAGLAMPPLQDIAVGCGLAGVHNIHWTKEFVALNPGFGAVCAETDAYTTLLGALGGKPGAIIALGTGSVGEVLLANGQRREVGGWGFPVSDEAGGAWLGMRAVNHLQRVLDGRAAANPFASAVLTHCGGDKDAVFAWLAQANQTRYAELAPLVIRFAAEVEVARTVMQDAGKEVAIMAQALDPSAELPIALCGGLADAVAAYLPTELAGRVQKPQADSAAGAMILIQQHLQYK
ncbi:BadF/BadG/BcrA/BcrD ATPase family protein [Undibacterium sp. Ji50W]|uniref:BadF/BadG/BcrA/BcrD ATPase family protein n=1 Tax=Undibacterium sp. Ji50W TaxID=3413041 RepID=UPI003BF174D8